MSQNQTPPVRASAKLHPRRSIHGRVDDADVSQKRLRVEGTANVASTKLKDSNEESEESVENSEESENEYVNDENNTSDSDSPLNSTPKALPLFKDGAADKKSELVVIKSVDSTTDIPKSKVSMIVCLITVIALPVLFALAPTPFNEEESPVNINSISGDFLSQDASFWIDFSSGVDDVINMNRPSTFIFLYRQEAESTLKTLLPRLSHYATCKIRDCSKHPINITDRELNSAKVVDDYGYFINKYREKLWENGVMVINNLENVKGVSAQAFHSFCDEYTPLIERSLFIFTVKVDQYQGKNKMRFVETYLKQKWTDIKVDTLNALITRISSMVEEIYP